MTYSELASKIDKVARRESEAFSAFFEAAKKSKFAKREGRTVVYIEDDPDQVNLLKTIIGVYCKLTILPAASAEAGRELIAKKGNRLKLIIMDLSLDVDCTVGTIEGLKLLKWIKEEYPEVPLILLTLHRELVQDIQQMYPGISIFLKAEDSAPLVRAITEAVGMPVEI